MAITYAVGKYTLVGKTKGTLSFRTPYQYSFREAFELLQKGIKYDKEFNHETRLMATNGRKEVVMSGDEILSKLEKLVKEKFKC